MKHNTNMMVSVLLLAGSAPTSIPMLKTGKEARWPDGQAIRPVQWWSMLQTEATRTATFKRRGGVDDFDIGA